MENAKRSYFEVWGDLEAQNNTLKALLLSMTGLLLVSLVVVYMVTVKPPVVIRVSDIGKSETVSNYPVSNAVTEPELFYFTKLFVRKFTEYNSYTISSDIAEAFNMMTANYQKIARKEVLDSNLVSKISQSSINTRMEVREIKLEREDTNYAVLSLLGLRTIQSYQNRNLKEESLFKGDVILKKVPRTMDCPQGLLVEEYREVLIKKIEQ